MKSAIVFYILGLFVFYFIADYQYKEWKEIYYLWDKTKDVILWVAAYQLLKRLRPYLLPVVIFSIIRVLWDLTAWIISEDINNTKVIDWLFILLPLSIIWIYLNELRQCQRLKWSYGSLMVLGIALLACWVLIGLFLL